MLPSAWKNSEHLEEGIELSYLHTMLNEQELHDGVHTFQHRYLCHYRPKSHGSDHLSLSLLRFKKRLQADWQAWTECAAELLLPLVKNSTLIIRALHQGETRVGQSALDELGTQIERKANSYYQPELLSKTKYIPSLKHLTQRERIEVLQDVYQFASPGVRVNSVLILDDILTTGATLQAIANAVSKVIELPTSFFTLAYTTYDDSVNQGISLQGHAYEWQESQWIAKENEEAYRSLHALKMKIQTDQW